MKELKCPKCGSIFTVDEADYASIISQVRNAEFEEELHRRLGEMRGRQEAEQKVKEVQAREIFGRQIQAKDLEINNRDQEISRLRAELKGIEIKKSLELDNAVLKTRDQMKEVIGVKEKEIAELRNAGTLAQSRSELEKKALRKNMRRSSGLHRNRSIIIRT